MFLTRPATAADAVAIAAVHVAAWRNTYPGILPSAYLARMSVSRQAILYERAIRHGVCVHVAVPANAAGGPRIVGFATGSPQTQGLADGEIETLYVLDDYRERSIGRRLLAALAADLAAAGCESVFCWVLADNPSRFFYRRLGGQHCASSVIKVAGLSIPQTAFRWTAISDLFGDPQQPDDSDG